MSSLSSSDQGGIVQEELDDYDVNDIYSITDNDKNNTMVRKTGKK